MQLNLRSSCCIFILLFLLTFSKNVIAQTSTVTGKVTDDAGNPLQGVSVSLKGTSTGTTTTADGTYRLPVERRRGDALIFSYVGFADKELPIGNNTELNVRLETSGQSLDAVVVVGYGTQRRKDITGSVVSVDKQRLEDLPNTNFAQALQGAVPGISINLNNAGAEGNDNSIIIRGRNSIKASNSPLIVLDGIPYNGGISDINPSDIAAIQVLKDASAAAIYGSRGSNGVILITTKKGNIGKAVISYDGFYGVQDISNLPPIMSPEEFYQFKITREPNSVTQSEQDNYDAKNFPNWLDLATRQGSRSQHTVGIRGGNSSIKYYLSGTVLDVKGVAVNDKFKRLSSRINLEATITDWLTVGT
ncbi:MAG: TonB-dependent receptor plug domain-containing protein, partial [Chitinophagaceae bacterium]